MNNLISLLSFRVWEFIENENEILFNYSLIPVDMKNGMRNLPSSTLSLRAGKVPPSNGKARQISTYKTTPKL